MSDTTAIILVLTLALLSVALLAGRAVLQRRKSRFVLAVETLFVITILMLTIVVRPYIIETAVIPSQSMVPTLEVADKVFVNTFIFRFREPRIKEVVIFRPPESISEGDGDTYVKRVLGVPGDVLEVVDGVLYRNGEAVKEPYLKEKSQEDMGPGMVPPGKYFLMGDNRNNSEDSRTYGPFDRKQIVGRATLRFWPLNRIGYVK